MGGELLKWKNHQSSFTQTISSARSDGDYYDVTLVCNGLYYRVHKLVLANCSEYFTQMLHNTDDKHPLIVLSDIRHEVLETLLDYVYDGQVNVLRSDLPDLFKAAARLNIKGLKMPQGDDNAAGFPNDNNILDFLQKVKVEDNDSGGKRPFENDVGDSKRMKVEYDSDDKLQCPNTQPSAKTKGLQLGSLDGDFLPTHKVVELLTCDISPCSAIPPGLKENVYFVVDNTSNIARREHGMKSVFMDDCGIYDSASGCSPKTLYLVASDGSLKKTYLRNGKFCVETAIKKVRKFVPLDPQPSSDEVLEVHRYYSKLKSSLDYKRRVTWLGNAKYPSTEDQSTHSIHPVAVVEYLGQFPSTAKPSHGNCKSITASPT